MDARDGGGTSPRLLRCESSGAAARSWEGTAPRVDGYSTVEGQSAHPALSPCPVAEPQEQPGWRWCRARTRAGDTDRASLGAADEPRSRSACRQNIPYRLRLPSIDCQTGHQRCLEDPGGATIAVQRSTRITNGEGRCDSENETDSSGFDSRWSLDRVDGNGVRVLEVLSTQILYTGGISWRWMISRQSPITQNPRGRGKKKASATLGAKSRQPHGLLWNRSND